MSEQYIPISRDIGLVTAYGYYLDGGGTGTEEEFKEELATLSEKAAEATAAAAEAQAAVASTMPEEIDAWLAEHIDVSTGYVIDDTLALDDAAPPASAVGELKSALEDTSEGGLGNRWLVFKQGRYKAPSTTIIGETISYDGSSTAQVCTICPCQNGDVFTLKLSGPSGTVRGWFVCDSDMKALARANASITPDGEEIAITQTNAAYFCCNNQLSGMPSGYYAFKGTSVRKFIDDSNRLNYFQVLTEEDDADSLNKSGWYTWSSGSIPNHVPYNTSGIVGKLLNLYRSNTSITQIYFPVTSSGNLSVQHRSKTSSGWNDWLLLYGKYNFDLLESRIDDIIDEIKADILVLDSTATGIPARIVAAAPGSAECETTSTTVLRYRENLMTLTDAPSASTITKNSDGAFVLNASPTSSSYINIQKGIKLKGGVTYRVDGSPQTNDNCALCFYVDGERKAYQPDGTGATYTPETDVTADLRLRIIENSVYTDVLFYPVVCENQYATRVSPSSLTLLEGQNEVVGLSFDALTVTYDQSKIELLRNDVDNTIRYDFALSDIVPYMNDDGYCTSSFTVSLKQNSRNNGRIIGINSQHISGSKASIKIKIVDSLGDAIYTSRDYDIGGTIESITQEFKAPPFVGDYNYISVVFTIPAGTSVQINDFYSFEAAQARHNDNCGIKWHAHAGFPGMMPANSIPSFQMAGKLGFSSCITIPKFTTDGVGICFHDDNTISDELRWMDGTAISGTDDVGISNYSYEYITENFRLKSTKFGVLHVPTLDEYFKICSMYNMSPIFSVHTDGFGMTFENGFVEIRRLAEKWNVLSKMWIKSGNPNVQSAANTVFGTDIAGRILLRGAGSSWNPLAQAKSANLVPSDATSAKDGICPLVFELFQTAATDEAIALGLSEGFKVSVAVVSGGLTGMVMKSFINKGVTEFTDDYHCSIGTDWMDS